MKNRILLLSLILIICVICFIPVNERKAITVRATFFNVYQQLINGSNWKNWRTDIRRKTQIDSAKVFVKKTINGYQVKYDSLKISIVPVNGYSFGIKETSGDNSFDYYYTAFPDKSPDKTQIIVTQKTDILHLMLDYFKKKSFLKTHIQDFKNYMENSTLYYGFNIIKNKVIDTEFIVLRRAYSSKNKLKNAAAELAMIKSYLKINGGEKKQLFIAQFVAKKDNSIQINIGIPVNKKVAAIKPFDLMQMPKSGILYTVRFKGKFVERDKAYAAVERYFRDRQITKLMLPFETYLDGKMPTSDTDIVNIQLNFPSF